MAANASDIVTRAQVATALRLIGEDVNHNELLDALIEGAAQWIESQCRLGILDTREVRTDMGGLAIDANGDLVVTHRSSAIRDFAWESGGVGPISVNDAGLQAMEGGRTKVPKPVDGRPTPLFVAFTRSTPPNRIPGTIRAAMMLLVRDMYDAKDRVVQASWAVTTLIQPYKDVTVGGASETQSRLVQHEVAPMRTDNLRAGWAASADVSGAIYGPPVDGIHVTVPDATGEMWLVVWRSDAAGGDPAGVAYGVGGFPARVTFGAAVDQLIDGVPGKAIITTSPLNAGLTSGTVLEVT